MEYNLLISKIKEKKPLDRLDDSIVLDRIILFLNKNPKIMKKIDYTNEKNSGFKEVLKNVRDELNKRYGVFWSSSMTLEGHKSSAERQEFYSEIYKKIFSITGMPSKILDVSCGMNPLSIPYMNFRGEYIGTELAAKDCAALNKWFSQNKIKGKVIQVDLTKKFELPSSDVVFLFKVFDSVEEKGHKLAEEILKKLDCKYAVVSFATASVRGVKMNFPHRGWIERLVSRLGLSYEKLEFENEIFYVVKMK